MTLDNAQQKQFLLEMMQQVQFPGATLEIAYAVKQAILNAQIAAPDHD